MSHVFISYKHDDLDFAENVQSRLEKAGIEVWIDHSIRSGDEWRNQIDQAIKAAFAMIVIMTPEAKASEYVTYEWSFAVGIGIRVIPVMCAATPLHPRLEALQFLDFTIKNARPWEKLVKEVQEAAKSPRPVSTGKISTLSFAEQARAALNGMEVSARQNAIATLAQANSSEAHEALLEALSHPVADVRQQAVGAMGNIQYQAAVPRLVELLYDPVQNVRVAAIGALRNIKDEKAVAGLLTAFTQASVHEKAQIVWAFYGVEDDAVVSALLTQYEDQDADTWLRGAIIVTLGSLNCAKAIPTLKKALRDPEQSVSAVRGLFQVGSEEAIHAIVDALLTMDRTQCEGVLRAVDRTDKFIAHLDDVYRKHLPGHATIADREMLAKVRRRVIWIFGMLRSNNVIPTLITAMDDEDLVVQQETVLAFKEIKDERSLPALMTILRWRFEYYDETTLLYVIQALFYVGNASVIPQLKTVLKEMLRKSWVELAIRVVNIFGKFGEYDTIEYLRKVKTNIITTKRAFSGAKQELIDAVDNAIYTIRARL